MYFLSSEIKNFLFVCCEPKKQSLEKERIFLLKQNVNIDAVREELARKTNYLYILDG